jgi:uncharacterized membrane protein
MNYKILLSFTLLLASTSVSAQSTNRAFAITSDGQQDHIWMNIRQVDLGTGQITQTLFQRNKTNFVLTDVNAKKVSTPASALNGNIFQSKEYPTGSMVAAAAFDRRSNKLFFTPMRVGELRWLDLTIKNETPQFYTVTSPVIDFGPSVDEATHITRMVIAADGNGYAVTNDGNHFIKFTTGKKPVITDLGNLIDNEKNNGISIHNKCTSWGGDMLADAYGKLYIISAAHQVFEIDINSRVATHMGAITGLPNNFTSNAAAVNDDGEIVVGSANVFAGYFKLNLADLKASPIEGSDKTYNASDLANGNLLFQKEADAARKNSITAALLPANTFGNADQRVYPNPVTANNFNVFFDTQKAGNYSITLTDLSGRVLQTEKVNVGKVQQVENIPLKSRTAKGMYFVTVVDEAKQILFKEKIIIQ